ncbi:MAG: hypothetical protein CVU84_07385 [Firmicutes bacterium HGW-Firmicutes-1]|jgi:UDP-N-acetylglucosamine:LPS N-acetylglucosamine transferase|nr:MAG: hypothetical protein CVU84_07385 [Firmicutes bacterium HGW-Firmicutes-1]
MQNKFDVLILTAGFGTGHVAVSQALKEHILAENSGLRVHIVDFYEIIHPVFHKIMYKGYEVLVRQMPQLYNKYYYAKEKHFFLLKLDTTSRYSIKKFDSYMRDINPKVVISTFPSCTGYLAKYKKEYRSKMPLLTCITDVVDNNEWLYKENDLYFVADPLLKEGLMNKGISKNKIVVTGIPIRTRFIHNEETQILKEQLGYKPEDRIILLMGGGLGLLPRNEIFYKWLGNLKNVKIVALTSKNNGLYHKLQELQDVNIRLFEYCDKVPEYMRIADILIGKSGGITMFEAIASTLPIIVYKPILGQEIENCNYIREKGIGYIADDIRGLKQTILNCLDEDVRDTLMKNLQGLQQAIDMKLLGEKIVEFLDK